MNEMKDTINKRREEYWNALKKSGVQESISKDYEIPNSLEDIIKPNELACALWEFSKKIKEFSNVLAVLIIIGGTSISVYAGLPVERYDDFNFIAFLVSALTWCLYLIISQGILISCEYLLKALSSIVRSNQIKADTALYVLKNK